MNRREEGQRSDISPARQPMDRGTIASGASAMTTPLVSAQRDLALCTISPSRSAPLDTTTSPGAARRETLTADRLPPRFSPIRVRSPGLADEHQQVPGRHDRPVVAKPQRRQAPARRDQPAVETRSMDVGSRRSRSTLSRRVAGRHRQPRLPRGEARAGPSHPTAWGCERRLARSRCRARCARTGRARDRAGWAPAACRSHRRSRWWACLAA